MYWIIAGLVAIFGLALLGRRRPGARQPLRFQQPDEPDIRPLKPGEVYDDSVKLATVPNGPLADLWCQRLREQGIEAFYKPTQYLTSFYGFATTMAGYPQEIWVGEHSAERARELFPELG